MSSNERTFYVKGNYVKEGEAHIPIMDRGFLFADGVYEVSTVIDGKLIDNDAHLARLFRSLESISIPAPFDIDTIQKIQNHLIEKNKLTEGIVYIQVTRGVAERDFAYSSALSPTVVLFTQSKSIVDHPLAKVGAKVVTTPDLRWARRDIKSIGLLAQVIAKQEAVSAGAYEAIMLQDQWVTEGSSSSFFIITTDGRIVARPLSNTILAGITRQSVLRLADEQKIKVENRPFTIQEALAAAEAFVTGAVGLVMPVVSIDGQHVGNGQPGPLTKRLRQIYLESACSKI